MRSVLPSTVRIYQQWYFSPEGLSRTPSAEEGIPLEVELSKREQACTIAARIALTIQRPGEENVDCHLVSAGAAAFIHRLYMRASVVEYDPWDVGPVCVWLSGKDSEKALRLTYISLVTVKKKRKEKYRLAQDPHVDNNDPEVIALSKKFLVLEEQIANLLCWQFIPALPYQPFALGMRRVIGRRGGSFALLCACDQSGFAFLNDALPTPLVILQPPSVIACAAYILTAAAYGFASIETLLDTFHEWKHDFGISDEEEIARDEDDVEECFLWMAYFQRETRHRPEFAKYSRRRPRPFPQPNPHRSALPSPSNGSLAPTPAGATPAGDRFPYEVGASSSVPPAAQPSSQPNGRNPYEAPPPDASGGDASGGWATNMDVDSGAVMSNGVH